MTQVELRRDLGLLLCRSTGENGGGNYFQERHGYILYKDALMHWLNVIEVAA